MKPVLWQRQLSSGVGGSGGGEGGSESEDGEEAHCECSVMWKSTKAAVAAAAEGSGGVGEGGKGRRLELWVSCYGEREAGTREGFIATAARIFPNDQRMGPLWEINKRAPQSRQRPGSTREGTNASLP
ncbi:hypothetical protein FKP32DRAFT_501552 [Trametes sanguinea]|nr:hypothetical protein FKP32DRAFT_501552 [Trametes sanguinea]